jgi:hypothetical protein
LLASSRPPWRKLAGLVQHRTSATVPIDPLAVATEFADIERADWREESVDGITINCSDLRPQIFYRGDPSDLRTRFTIAHELGHAVIPWHTGSAECAMPMPHYPRSITEREADEFAAELLIPTDWLRHAIRIHNADLDLVLADIAQAKASATASIIALATVLPIGWALQMNNNAVSATHDYGRQLSRREADRIAPASGLVQLHEQSVRWWRLFELVPIPEIPDDKEIAYTCFERAYADLGHATRTMKSIDGSVSAVLGGLGGLLQFEVAYGHLMWRLTHSQDAPLFHTADFRKWLAWKVLLGTRQLKTWQP